MLSITFGDKPQDISIRATSGVSRGISYGSRDFGTGGVQDRGGASTYSRSSGSGETRGPASPWHPGAFLALVRL